MRYTRPGMSHRKHARGSKLTRTRVHNNTGCDHDLMEASVPCTAPVYCAMSCSPVVANRYTNSITPRQPIIYHRSYMILPLDHRNSPLGRRPAERGWSRDPAEEEDNEPGRSHLAWISPSTEDYSQMVRE